MKEIESYNIPLNYKEGTYNTKEIKDFSGATINLEYTGCEIFRYIVPEHDEEVRIYSVPDNPVFMATYDNDGIINYIELQREDRKELIYIKFKDKEHAKESILKYLYYWSDKISEKILEHKEKITRLLIDYSDDWYQPGFFVNAYIPEDVQQAIDDYNEYIKSINEKYRPSHYDYPVGDISRNYCGYISDGITPDIITLEVMFRCADMESCNELYELAVSVMTEGIKNNVLDKIARTEDFRFIPASYGD